MATQEHNYNPSHTNERNETVKRYDDHPSYRYSSHMDGIAGHHTKIHHKTTDGLTGALSAERFYLCWDNQPMKCVAVRGFLAHLHAVKAASASAPSQSSVSPLVHCTEWQRPAGAEAYLVLDCPIPTLQRGPPHNDVARRHQAFLTAIKQYFESHDAISAGLRAVDDPHYYYGLELPSDVSRGVIEPFRHDLAKEHNALQRRFPHREREDRQTNE